MLAPVNLPLDPNRPLPGYQSSGEIPLSAAVSSSVKTQALRTGAAAWRAWHQAGPQLPDLGDPLLAAAIPCSMSGGAGLCGWYTGEGREAGGAAWAPPGPRDTRSAGHRSCPPSDDGLSICTITV